MYGRWSRQKSQPTKTVDDPMVGMCDSWSTLLVHQPHSDGRWTVIYSQLIKSHLTRNAL